MAIPAFQLDGPARPSQFFLQMHLMIELDGARIFLSSPQRCELRMAPVEAADVGGKSGRSVFILSGQIGVALRTSAIAGAGQAQHSFVLHVAIRTARRKSLFRMMDGPVVAGQARLIGDRVRETRRGNVACGAFMSDQCMRVRDGSGIVGRRASAQTMPAQPAQAQRRANPGTRIRRQRGIPRRVLK